MDIVCLICAGRGVRAGLRSTIGNRVGVISASGVRIPPSPYGCARWGASGALYSKSAICETECPEEGFRFQALHACRMWRLWSCAIETSEPRQDREVATVRGIFNVPQGFLS